MKKNNFDIKNGMIRVNDKDYKSLEIFESGLKRAIKSKKFFDLINIFVFFLGVMEFCTLAGCLMYRITGGTEKCNRTFLIGFITTFITIIYGILYYAQIIGYKRIFIKYSQRFAKGEKLFVVNEHNEVIPVFYVDRNIFKHDLIGWNIKKAEYLYTVKYSLKDKGILYVSASRIFSTIEDAELFSNMRKDEQTKAFIEEIGKEDAQRMLDDSEINDIISIYCYYWDYAIKTGIVRWEDFYPWVDNICIEIMPKSSLEDIFDNVKMHLTSDGYYFPIGAYMSDINFLVDEKQVHDFIRFYLLWKDFEEKTKKKDEALYNKIKKYCLS